MLFDANAHLGTWPFTLVPPMGPARLIAQLGKNGIGRAAVSPIEAILAPDPMPANRALLAAVRGKRALVPVPVVNPALANWEEQLEAALAGPARVAKLFPNYHNYRLEGRKAAPFLEAAHRRGLRLVVSVRVEDDRHRYFGMCVTMVPVKSVAAFLKAYPGLHPLILGLGMPEVRLLAPKHDNFSTDTSFVEWIESVRVLTGLLPARRIFLGSHTPFFSTKGSIAKLVTAHIPASARAAIGGGNAQRFFAP
jgi:uncharacterized protein